MIKRNINKLLKDYYKLNKKYWIIEKINNFYSLRTKKNGDSLWIISGIHGEEPAGPIAISKTIKFLDKLGKNIPIIILPLCNPEGYILNKRYPSSNISVGSSEYFLLDSKGKQRIKKPESKKSKNLVSYILKMSKFYKPKLVLDLHEDTQLYKFYFYLYGNKIQSKKIINLFNNKIQFVKKGKTRFNEKIVNGIVKGTKDGSIDELLYSKKIIFNNKIYRGPSAETVIVFESPTKSSLERRIKAHSILLKNCKKLIKKEKIKRNL